MKGNSTGPVKSQHRSLEVTELSLLGNKMSLKGTSVCRLQTKSSPSLYHLVKKLFLSPHTFKNISFCDQDLLTQVRGKKTRFVLHSLCMSLSEHTALYIQFISPESVREMIMVFFSLDFLLTYKLETYRPFITERVLFLIQGYEGRYFI